ncbi:DUF6283 family protein [Arthrobacter terrae]|uniref:DUF6283 family protein n=1 Tax=Arthrobacter terrae TaxID=2935737 RepID=UPI001E28910A|nr:DUF6283 family protein [Arthrobacter terrae]
MQPAIRSQFGADVNSAITSGPDPAKPRKSPCASCPYRKNVPSGVWDGSEYQKLPGYDGEIHEQKTASIFMCHQQDGCVCSGWLGHRSEPGDMLAVRLGLMRGSLDLGCLDYTTNVPLFDSGAAAAEHGLADVQSPGRKAQAVISKIANRRGPEVL